MADSKSRGALAFVIVSQGLTANGLERQSGLVQSKTWIWLLSSHTTPGACSGGFRYADNAFRSDCYIPILLERLVNARLHFQLRMSTSFQAFCS